MADIVREATQGDYTRLGKIVSGIAQPGSNRVSDAMFNLIDSEGGVHEKSLVAFCRSQGGMTSISQEDIESIEDLIEQGWRQGRAARGLRDTGISTSGFREANKHAWARFAETWYMDADEAHNIKDKLKNAKTAEEFLGHIDDAGLDDWEASMLMKSDLEKRADAEDESQYRSNFI